MVRIAILGTGAMGLLVGALLGIAVRPPLMLTRARGGAAPVRHLVRVRSADAPPLETSLDFAADPAAVVGADCLLVLVKAWATADALAPWRPYLSSSTLVLTLQNGLGNREQVVAALPDHPVGRIAAGVTTEAALRVGPREVAHTGRGRTTLGPAAGVPRTLAELAAALTAAGLPATVEPEIEQAIWEKLAVNAAINGLTALAGVENGAIATRPDLAEVATAVAREVAAVAAVEGIILDDPAATALSVASATARNRSSMAIDVETGRRSEVDAIHGAVVERARAAGIATPVTATLAALIRAHESVVHMRGD
ncbi:MAG: 2-dehydropantoate 2-reductase [Thermomicrobiales bacterium]|nr:2-dehydropantoate 2-reductase [Thermomicrobiales bacterium]